MSALEILRWIKAAQKVKSVVEYLEIVRLRCTWDIRQNNEIYKDLIIFLWFVDVKVFLDHACILKLKLPSIYYSLPQYLKIHKNKIKIIKKPQKIFSNLKNCSIYDCIYHIHMLVPHKNVKSESFSSHNLNFFRSFLTHIIHLLILK